MSVSFLECHRWNFSQNKILDKYFPNASSFTVHLNGKASKCSKIDFLQTTTLAASEGKQGLHLNPLGQGHFGFRFPLNKLYFKGRINRDGTLAAAVNLGDQKIHGHKVNFSLDFASSVSLNPILFRLNARFPNKRNTSAVSLRRGETNGYHLGFRTLNRRGQLTLGANLGLNVHNLRFSQFDLLLAYRLKEAFVNLNHRLNPSHEGGLRAGNVELNVTSRKLRNKVLSLNLRRNVETKETTATVGGRLKLKENALLLGKIDSHFNTVLGTHIDAGNGLTVTLATHFNPSLGAKAVDLSKALPLGLSLKYKI